MVEEARRAKMITDLLKELAFDENVHAHACAEASALRKEIDRKRELVHNWIREENLAHGAYVAIEDRIYRVAHNARFGDLHSLDPIELALVVKTLKAE
jgi:hypothetical protein